MSIFPAVAVEAQPCSGARRRRADLLRVLGGRPVAHGLLVRRLGRRPGAPISRSPRCSGPNSLDPAQLVDGQQMYVWSSIYDTLLARDSATGELIPNAAYQLGVQRGRDRADPQASERG